MVSLEAIRTPIASDIDAFEEFLKGQFSSDGKLMSEMLTHVLSARGKSVRPIIVMLTSALTSSANARQWVEGERNCTKRTYLAAMMVEMLHTASLVHDDVIDNADMRRGRPSVNALWQSRNAVVLGDFVLPRTLSAGMERAQYYIQKDGQPYQRKRFGWCCIGDGVARRCRADASLWRGAGYGIPDSGRHPRLQPLGKNRQTEQQRLARGQDYPAAHRGIGAVLACREVATA